MSPQTEVQGDAPAVGVTATPVAGVNSTEFYTTLATVAGVLLNQVPQQYVPLVAGLSGLYVACRTLLKAVHVLGYAKAVPDLPQLPAGATATSVTTVPK